MSGRGYHQARSRSPATGHSWALPSPRFPGVSRPPQPRWLERGGAARWRRPSGCARRPRSALAREGGDAGGCPRGSQGVMGLSRGSRIHDPREGALRAWMREPMRAPNTSWDIPGHPLASGPSLVPRAGRAPRAIAGAERRRRPAPTRAQAPAPGMLSPLSSNERKVLGLTPRRRPLGGYLGVFSAALLGLLGAVLGASFGPLGSSWGLLGSSRGRGRARNFCSGPLSGPHLGNVLGASWAVLEAF